MTKLEKRPRSLLLTVIMSSGVLAYIMFGFMPAQRSIGQLRNQLQEKRSFVLDVDRQYSQAGSVIRQIDATDSYAIAVRQTPEEWRVAGLLTGITQFAEASGVAVQSISPRRTTERTVLQDQQLEVLVEGPFAALFDFIRRLEEWPGTLWVTAIHLERQSEDSESLAARLELKVFTTISGSSD